jgi:hypothetical protein
MGKGTGVVLILIGIGLATIYTLGTLVDLAIDITWLDWRLFIAIPIWLIVIIISLIMIFIGASSFSKSSMGEKMFEKMFEKKFDKKFAEAGKVAEETSED